MVNPIRVYSRLFGWILGESVGYASCTGPMNSLLLQPIPGLEHPPHDEQAGDQEH
jgi:hypothetical protein